MITKTVNPVDIEGNNITLNLSNTAANYDWIRAARLRKKGTKKAKAEFEKLDDTNMLIDED